MSHFYRVNGTFRPNFLESEVGLVLKTYQIPAAMSMETKSLPPELCSRPMMGAPRVSFLTMWMSPPATTKGASCWLAVF